MTLISTVSPAMKSRGPTPGTYNPRTSTALHSRLTMISNFILVVLPVCCQRQQFPAINNSEQLDQIDNIVVSLA